MRLQFASSSKPPDHRRFRSHVSSSSQLPPLRTPKPVPIPKQPKQPSPPLQLKQKPSPLQFKPPSLAPPPPPDSSTPPLLKLFNTLSQTVAQNSDKKETEKETNLVSVEYYDPKPGDLVVGVVLSGNESKLDISVGADMLGSMVSKEALPFCKEEMDWLICDEEGFNGGKGKVGILRDEEGFREKDEKERRSVEAGTVIFAKVLGRTLSGRPLLSGRRWFRQIAWHRVRQIMQLNEPIEVTIFEWNTGGLLTRIEGIRAFLPKTELVNRVNSFTDLKNNVGKRMHVYITRIDEATNVLITSEKQAWEMTYLKPGTVLKGTVSKIFPYGAQIKIGDTTRSGLLHVSNISKERVSSTNDVLKINEEVKVLVIKSMFADKIYLSIEELESKPGLFLSNKEKVYDEAEEMAKKYRKKLADFPAVPTNKEDSVPVETLPFENEAFLYSNWKCFKFEQHNEIDINETIS